MRTKFFAFLRHVSSIEDTRQILAEMLATQNILPSIVDLPHSQDLVPPYPELNRSTRTIETRLRDDMIFITGRFRSGTTLLWNIFRHIPSATTYYEPFNERRWYDPAHRGNRVDNTHLGVSEYWAEYEGLPGLSAFYNEDWTRRQLYMAPYSWDPSMQQYIETLIKSAKGRPVLQFNRVDFRLSWLRCHFPGAKILHVFRHPRDQWCSTLGSFTNFPPNGKLRDFEPYDRFYLLTWARDLRNYFPFLTLDDGSHPYEVFYQIWKLAYLFGRRYAHFSISLENLLLEPKEIISKILSFFSIANADSAQLAELVKPVPTGRWTEYASPQWFSQIESRIDGTLDNYLSCVTNWSLSKG